jgi:hypothetical protein
MSDIIDKNESVYTMLNNLTYDQYSLIKHHFILQPHQVIPKYYLLTNENIFKLIIHYSLGSGKTNVAVYAILKFIELYKHFLFCRQYSSGNDFISANSVNQNVVVIGPWQTNAQIQKELLSHHEFRFISYEDSELMNSLLTSPIPQQQERGNAMRTSKIAEINKYIRFFGYQKFINALFPNIKLEKYNQNIDALINEYTQQKISGDEEFLKSLENNIIIIDEMQHLYNIQSLNTYGFAIAYVSKLARQYNIKMMFLTGTMLNSSIHEIVDVYNIISDNPKFILYEDYIKDVAIQNGIMISQLKHDKEKFFIDELGKNFMFYNVNLSIEKNIPVYTKKAHFYYMESTTAKDVKFLIYPKKKYLPEEIHVGNILVNKITDSQPICIYSVEVAGAQARAYAAYLKSIKNSENIIADIALEEETEKMFSIHDGVLPPRPQFHQNNIYEYDKVFQGDFFRLKNIRQYSAIGYEFCMLCLENSFNNEKTIAYHTKILNFGIRQYCVILKYNGFIPYNTLAQKDSVCKVCRAAFAMHNESLEVRLNNKVCNQFKPLVYAVLTGDVSQSDRDTLTNSIYNSPQNLHGDLISVMFVSDVAYSGVNFLNTQNILILSKISNISKWKQIFARIIRVGSHNLLQKKIAKVYTFVIQLPNEQELFPEFGGRTYEELFYKKNELSNVEIEKFVGALSKKCISETLLYHPEKYKQTALERNTAERLLHEDIENELKYAVKRILSTSPTSIWDLDNFKCRLHDPTNSVVYFNLSKLSSQFIQSFLVTHERITLFRYEDSDKTYIRIPDRILLNLNQKAAQITRDAADFNVISYTDFEILANRKNIIKELLDHLDSSERMDKIAIITKLLRHLRKDYSVLINKPAFWKFMYDIGNEFYDDDDTNFIFNHSTPIRSFAKMTGCYYNSIIILRDGTSKEILYKFPNTSGKPGFPFLFKISSMSLSLNTPFFLHVKIIRILEEEIIDRRKLYKGISCFTTDLKDLYQHFPMINHDSNRKKYCTELIFKICDLQLQTEEKIVFTPFEK